MIRKIKKNILGDYSTDTAFRYYPVIDVIKRYNLGEQKILEVGSGSLGIAPYFKKPLTGLDINFDETSSKNLKKIIYDGGSFPFEDNSFSLVISIDSLEHISSEDRDKHIKEMMRVAKNGIVVVVPTGGAAYEHDKRLADYFSKVKQRSDKYLSEHLLNGLPEKEEIEEMIKRSAEYTGKTGEIKISQPMLNLQFREIFMRCKISNFFILNLFYYAFLIILPFWSYLNFGKCYRTMIFYKINLKDI